MARQLFSPSWHSVALLRPRLTASVETHRHIYRGEVWFVMQDPVSGKFHRLSPSGHQFVQHMNGSATVQSIWDAMCAQGATQGGDIPTQEEIVNLLMQLHAADLMQADITPDASLLLKRHTKRQHQTWRQWLLNPMSLKLPLVDPDAFLDATVRAFGWLFSPLGAVLWLLIVVPALVLAGQHWATLTNNLSDQVLGHGNLWLMAAVFPIIKLAHELGHGFAVKTWGGKVNEGGIMLLVFAPAPYVDASAASGFRSKTRRAVVGAAGMLTELVLAALAMYVWVLVEPGLVRSIAYNVMIVAGVSTLVVNGNPLLRYDAYYILSDLIEMPNLAQRGQKYLTHLWNRTVFGIPDQDDPQESPSERRWLIGYTIVSWCYRVFITLSIALFIAGEFFFFGAMFAIWSITTLIALPIFKGLRYVLNNPILQRKRQRAKTITVGIVATLLVVLLLIPLPFRTQSQGVVWLPEQSMLRAGENGFFGRWLVEPGTRVDQGTAIFTQEDPLLVTEVAIAKAKVNEAQVRYNIDQFTNAAKSEVTKRQLQQEQLLLARAQEKLGRLLTYSQNEGTVVAAKSQDMPGQYFKKGELIGYVLDKKDLIARVVVDQNDIDLVRTQLKGAQLRMADSLPTAHTSTILRQVPSGVQELPSSALATQFGGTIAVDPQDKNGTKTLDRIFVFDMTLPTDVSPSAFGERVHVRFSHQYEPLGFQLWRRLRQLLLSRLAV
jgi:putative peptide zinc metalloprotease protein